MFQGRDDIALGLDSSFLVAGIDLGGCDHHVFASLGKGVPEGVLGIWSGFFREVLLRHFLDLDADLKLAGFQLALLGFEDLTLGLDGVLLQVLLVCKNLGDIRHQI